jgi:hypothetical protein
VPCAEDGHVEGGAEGGIGGEDCGWEDELDEGLKTHFEELVWIV